LKLCAYLAPAFLMNLNETVAHILEKNVGFKSFSEFESYFGNSWIGHKSRCFHLFFIKLDRAWFLVYIMTFYHQHLFSWHFEMNKILTLQFLSIVWNTLVSSVEWHLFDLWVQANAVQEISLRVCPWFLVKLVTKVGYSSWPVWIHGRSQPGFY